MLATQASLGLDISGKKWKIIVTFSPINSFFFPRGCSIKIGIQFHNSKKNNNFPIKNKQLGLIKPLASGLQN